MKKSKATSPETLEFVKKAGQALRRAAKEARRVARLHSRGFT